MHRKHTREILERVVSQSESMAEVLRLLGLKEAGGNYCHIKRRIKEYGLDTAHFKKYTTYLRHGQNKKGAADVLVYNTTGRRQAAHRLRRAMQECGVEYKCVSCGITDEYNGKPITLEVNHKDCDWLNNQLNNLEFLCPNCHSQMPNDAGKSCCSRIKLDKKKQIAETT
jgi:hypothetical protein